MASRAEITTRYAKAYGRASKKDKGRVLDEVVAVTGWSRDNARRRLVAAAKRAPGAGREVARVGRRKRADKFSYDARRVLARVWAASGGQCGKYLAASMALQLQALERHGELVPGGIGGSDPEGRYSRSVRAELLAMSAATIDRYLAPVKAKDAISGTPTTKAGPLLRTSIQVRRAGDEVEDEPGFFEVDTVAHCGPTLKGEFARSVNLTDVHTGWVFTRSIRNNAQVHVLSALQAATEPYWVRWRLLSFEARMESWRASRWLGRRRVGIARRRRPLRCVWCARCGPSWARLGAR
ncbi:integrase [Ruania albidiflava]|uniref:integrase n=1 Tax=Ruania albidiflava TaxID=366586 RepID=UPI0004130096|nr:integrase [Ruania albidiflava]